VLRQRLRGAEIRTKSQQVCKAGDFLVAEMDAKVGGYGFVPAELDGAIVSSHYFLFVVDQTKLFPAYLEVISQALILQQQIVAKGSTNYSAIRPSAVLGWQIPLPAMSVQKRIAANFEAIQSKLALVNNEITRQQSLLAKLKQAILQEAIQGKLTADWRAANSDVEPASQLLQRIQAEKARLIATKKLRPEKPLPKITADEIPFEIPNGWEWCRLGNILSFSSGDGLTSAQMAGGDVPVFGGNGINGYHDKANTEQENIVVGRVGANCGAVHKTPARAWVTDNAFITSFSKSCLDMDFLVLLLRCLNLNHLSYDGSQPVISGKRVYPLPTPLPPFAEQKVIVEKVEALMTTCRTLEAEIEHARTHAAHLLQAVLREAFSGERVAQDANDNPAPANTNVIPFPVRIGSISATDLHAGILAMAYQHHEQNPKHLVHFGHVKAEKIAHLVEAHLGIDLERMPVKAAAGPNDYPHLKKVESRARKANWFVVRQQKADGAYVFHKERGFDALLGKIAEALGERATEVDALIKLLLPLNTRQAEIVATLYAAWNNLLLLGRTSSDEDIVYEARENWHASKLEIEREKFFNGLEWMRKQGLAPVGRGRYVDTK